MGFQGTVPYVGQREDCRPRQRVGSNTKKAGVEVLSIIRSLPLYVGASLPLRLGYNGGKLEEAAFE